MFAETYIKDGILVKTKKHFFICPKCGLVQVSPADDSYEFGLCWICFLKSKGFYKSAMREIKTGWFVWSTNMLKLKIGWSFVENVLLTALFISILKNPHLNKTPKTATITSEFYSDWQIKTAQQYYSLY